MLYTQNIKYSFETDYSQAGKPNISCCLFKYNINMKYLSTLFITNFIDSQGLVGYLF